MKNKLFLKKGSMLHLSELGHRNFVYPSDNTVVLDKSCKAEKMTWVGSDKLIPVMLDRPITANNKPSSIVWVDSKFVSERDC
tara:strand:+ start:1023 stop:1268 length:246 start_codon:yes stop_codon:yes gene_type:complete